MISSFDKAIVALLGAIAYLSAYFFGTDLGLDADMINRVAAVVVALTPFLVYLVPNKSHV